MIARLNDVGYAQRARVERAGDFAIDASGTLPDGASFKRPSELKQILLGKKDDFVRCLSEKMLTYALGRGLEYYDRRPVMQIQETLAKSDYKFSVLVSEIVKSDPFRLRRGKEDVEPKKN